MQVNDWITDKKTQLKLGWSAHGSLTLKPVHIDCIECFDLRDIAKVIVRWE